MTTIYLVRHCESEGNACRRNHAKFDGIVTRKGLVQSEKVAERFRDVPVTAIYSSDAYRCRVTAAPLAKQKNLPIRYKRLLQEYTIGAWEAMSIGDTARLYPDRYARWLTLPYAHDIPGADPFWLVAERGVQAVLQIAKENPGGTVVAFTHTCTMSCAMTKFLGENISYYVNIKGGDNTAVTKLEVDENGGVKVIYQADVSHLPEALLRQNYPGRSGAANFGFFPVTLPEDAETLGAVCKAACAELPEYFDEETIRAEVRRSLEENPRYAVFPALMERRCGLVTVRSDPGLPADHGRLGVVYVDAERRCRGYAEQAFGEAIDVLRRNGKHWLVMEKSEEPHRKILFDRFCFEPMPGNEKLLRMAITVPGLNEPIY